MSKYINFSRCVVCRSKKNLDNYNGVFEVTMLLNTMYLTVMYPLDEMKKLKNGKHEIRHFLQEKGIVDLCNNNDFTDYDVLHCLRNGLAHFNIQVDPEVNQAIQEKDTLKENVLIDVGGDEPKSGQIERIKIWAKNWKSTLKCKLPCENPQCLPPQYHEKDGMICIFNFTVESLKDFTKFMIDVVLKALNDDICVDCPYRKDK